MTGWFVYYAGTASRAVVWAVRRASRPVPAAADTAGNTTGQSYTGDRGICDAEDGQAVRGTASV